ncbi:MAG: phosphomethylpyrimidine synthase ThiC, partial [Phycisphaerales bacterium]
MFASPDTSGMPKASSKTAWDFLPAGWSVVDLGAVNIDTSDVAFTKQTNPHDTALNTSFGGGKFISPREFTPYIAGNVSRDWLGCVTTSHKHVGAIAAPAQTGSKQGCTNCLGETHEFVEFNLATGRRVRVIYPKGFQPRTQLEHARLGIITPQMQRVAQREPHLSPAQVRDEIGAGRMVIPANINHLSHSLDSMCIGRASKTKVNANMGASPISSGTHEEVEKLKWAEKHGADTVMDLSTGGNLDECRAAILQNSCVPIGTVPIYSMIIGKKIEQLDWPTIEASLHHQAQQGVDYFTIHAGVRKAHLKYVKNRLIGIVSR